MKKLKKIVFSLILSIDHLSHLFRLNSKLKLNTILDSHTKSKPILAIIIKLTTCSQNLTKTQY